jgi:hypothetical protein
MSRSDRPRAAMGQARTKPFLTEIARLPIALLLASALMGCTGRPQLLVVGANPSDPAARFSPAAYRSALGSYTSRRPVAPSSWREQNERAAPVPKPAE